jgi:signal transduction histidine kinase
MILESDAAECERLKSVFKEYIVFTACSYREARLILDNQPKIEVLISEAGPEGRRLVNYCDRKLPNLLRVLMVDPQEMGGIAQHVDPERAHRVLAKPVKCAELLAAVEGAFSAAGSGIPGARAAIPTADLARVREAPTGYCEGNLRDANPNPTLHLKNDWMRIVAHDIRSPLSIINGYVTYLQENEGGLSDQGNEVLSRIRNTGQRLLGLLNNIMTLASLEEGRLELECLPCRPGDIFSAVVENLQGLAEFKHVQLTSSAEGAEPSYNLDHIKIEQVLQNLVSNAIKFTPSGGRIHLEIRAAGDQVLFSVQDTGVGLTQEQVDHVFEKFTRYSSTEQEGDGLGLAIAKALVDLHGGRIWVESQPGKGSTFSFTVTPQPEPAPRSYSETTPR